MSVNVVINETLAMHGIFTTLPWCRTMPCIIDTATFYSNRWGSNLGINLFHKSDMWFCEELFFFSPLFLVRSHRVCVFRYGGPGGELSNRAGEYVYFIVSTSLLPFYLGMLLFYVQVVYI